MFKVNGQRVLFNGWRSGEEKHKQCVSIKQITPERALINFKLRRSYKGLIYVGIVTQDRIKNESTKRDRGALSYKLNGK